MTACFTCGDVAFTVDAPGTVIENLAEFYETVTDVPEHSIHVSVEPRPRGALPALLAEGASSFRLETAHDRAHVVARRFIRERWLADMTRGDSWTIVHASCVELEDGRAVVMAGEKFSGKTTLALDAMFEHGARFVSNDVLLLRETGGSIELVGVPTWINLRPGTLLAYADRLPLSSDERARVEQYRGLDYWTLWQKDEPLYFTSLQLGGRRYPRIALDPVDVVFTMPRFRDGPHLDAGADGTPASVFRHDWLCKVQREAVSELDVPGRAEFEQRSARLLALLPAARSVLHSGSFSEVLDAAR